MPNAPLLPRVSVPGAGGWLAAIPPNPPLAAAWVEANGGANASPGFAKSGETGERGRSRTDCGEPEEPDAGDESSVRARLAWVGAGEASRSSSTAGSSSAGAGPPCASRPPSGAGVVAADFCFRDGGRGLGRDLLEEASSSVSVGNAPRLSGVEGTGRPLAFPRPLSDDTARGGVWGGDVGTGGVVGGGGAFENASLSGSVLAFLDCTVCGDASEGGVIGRTRFGAR